MRRADKERLYPSGMSRTPLFRMLRRSYRAASYALSHAEPIDEVLDRAAFEAANRVSRDVTRREFMAGTAAIILTNFTGGAHGVKLGAGSAADQAARFVTDLERVFPGVRAARAGMKEVRFHWPSFPWTQGSYASYLTGQRTAFGGSEGEPVDGLHFAGEHCSLDQGWMQGAIQSGLEAVNEIVSV